MARLRKTPSNRWVAEISLGKGVDGKYKTMTLTRDVKAIARKEAEAIEAQIKMGVDPKGGNVLFGDYLNRWWIGHQESKQRREKPFSPKTIEQYDRDVRNLAHVIGHIPLNRLTATDCEKALWTPSVGTWKEGNASPHVAASRRKLLNPSLNAAVRDGLIPLNPHKGVETFSPTTAMKVEHFTREPLLKFFEVAEGTQYFYSQKLQLHLGCRLGELLALSWDDVDFEKRELFIRHSVDWIGGRPYKLKDTKTHETRHIPLDTPTLQLLQHWRSEQMEDRHFMLNGIIFPAYNREVNGEIQSDRIYKKGLLELYKAAGIKRPKQPTHIWRHTCAAMMLDQQVDIYHVSKWLGHKSVKTTEEHYGFLLPNTLEKHAGVVNQYLKLGTG